ncbi:polyhydroxyalkanoic acid system family protein [Altererythrobacter sp. GH1-8]|uniref:polyhydroxyalkanoic acid system family protein n=1 Tax=Altererythrobacter sp. GH1-8 TaxID=3349333 RepID=UPI00374D6D48
MRVALPHELGKDEVRRRLKERSHEIADYIPGGMARVSTGWDGEDCMTLNVSTMGQSIDGQVEIEDEQVVFVVDLPLALSFIGGMLESAIRKNGTKLLENG